MKPSYDLSEIGIAKTLQKCKQFLPQLQVANDELLDKISSGDRSCVIDSDMLVYRGKHEPKPSTGDEGDIVLDVGVGVFDVNNPSVDGSSLKTSGITTVTLPDNSEVFAEEQPLIMEVDTRPHPA
ncbi:uncharacterized protein BBOV_IV004525 [Babesia bovis T2Bo]|uniref:uncharacterized protein n=1 Tax=Babesia bovis T2Bo TaxID=484906 RepID=UPI001D77203A|nr:uncharacterized protein BBOV_IV004525 [Babesia bovis T2Bo]KAG6439962.1 hypothetical protein BBOV_IV004525 [Babesia bovis T2Bo]